MMGSDDVTHSRTGNDTLVAALALRALNAQKSSHSPPRRLGTNPPKENEPFCEYDCALNEKTPYIG
jgi:hypothetical protein